MVKILPANQEMLVRSLGGEDSLEKEQQPTPIFLPGEPHGQRSLAAYSPWNSPGQNTGVGSLSLLQGSSQPREDITEHTPKEETGREASILWEHHVVIQVPGKGRGDKRKTQKEGTQTNTV